MKKNTYLTNDKMNAACYGKIFPVSIIRIVFSFHFCATINEKCNQLDF